MSDKSGFTRRDVCAVLAGGLAYGAVGSRALAQEAEIKIGVLNDMAGPISDITGKGSVVAANMAVEDFGGTAAGRKVTILAADHQNKVDIGSAIARKWLDVENVDAIIDVPNSSVGLAVQNLTRERKKVFLITAGQLPEFFGKDCSPTSVHWNSDTYALARGTVSALIRQGYKSWFFLTADFAFGISAEAQAAAAVKINGGTVLGSVRHPFNTPDFASFLLQAQAASPQVIGLANAGGDTVQSLKQAKEFGIVNDKTKIAGLAMFITDIDSVGLNAAQGTFVTESFYWDMNEKTRAFSQRFMKRHNGRPPTSLQAAVYGAITHYLKAINATKSNDGPTVVAKMKETPVQDMFTDNAIIRADGRVLRNMYLFQVKSPEESKYPWDYYKSVATISPEESIKPMSEGHCAFVEAANHG
jgi:branched-chain amino acid transport system substrate-binding protein